MFSKIVACILSCTLFSTQFGFFGHGGRRDFEAAEFSEIFYTTYTGGKIKVSVDGGNFCVSADEGVNVSLVLYTASDSRMADAYSANSNEAIYPVAQEMREGALYYIQLSYELNDMSFYVSNNYVIRQDDAVKFYKSPVYDFNVERCSELWVDDVSLAECLEPQNDIECDNPSVVSYAEQICEGATNDWEKVFDIYTYITNYMAYDNVQLDDEAVYQDDALLILRRSIGVCEGFANAFVALCRAEGIPATVEFGIGLADYDDMLRDDLDEDETPDHAWAAVCIDKQWYFVDPTFDIGYSYDSDFRGAHYTEIGSAYAYYLLPLEAFSYDHKICDADTAHSIEKTGSCGDNATYSISRDGTLTIYGSGVLELPYGCNDFSKVVFDPSSSITVIGEECFQDCDLITSVVLPDTVSEICDRAFYTCEDLEYVYLPEGLDEIGKSAFDYCDELAYIRIPDSVTSVGAYAFDDCSRLYLSVPSSLRRITNQYGNMPYCLEVR